MLSVLIPASVGVGLGLVRRARYQTSRNQPKSVARVRLQGGFAMWGTLAGFRLRRTGYWLLVDDKYEYVLIISQE